MRIFIDSANEAADLANVELLKKAGYEVCDITEYIPAAVTNPDAWKGITSMDDVYKFHGLENGYVPDMSGYPEFMRAYKVAEFKAQLMAAAINGSWVADWTDTKQRKYYPWWDVVDKNSVSGRGLSLGVVVYVGTGADVGPRLVFESDEKVRHAVKFFTEVFEDHYFTK